MNVLRFLETVIEQSNDWLVVRKQTFGDTLGAILEMMRKT